MHINKENNTGCYFVTFTVVHWYYLFDRYERWDIVAKSLQYCIDQKELRLYSFVFMLNHLHLIFSSPDASGFIRDFKRFTAKVLKKNILETEPHVLNLFLDKDGTYELWQKTNMPILIESDEFFLQKMHYIHNNPVKKEYVEKPEYWYWSSANLSCELKVSSVF